MRSMESARALSRAVRLLLIGAPGVGKGTQTERMLKRYPQLSSISSGDLLRDNVRHRTPLGIHAESIMKSGKLVPDTMMLRLILNELNKRGWMQSEHPSARSYTLNYAAPSDAAPAINDNFIDDVIVGAPMTDGYKYSDSPNASFILDGFPRNLSQATQVDSLIPINFVIHINTPPEVIMDRIQNRWVHAPSGRVYNTTFNPPKVTGKDDVTGEPLIRRDDDDPEVWKRRLRGFEETSRPLLDHYAARGLLWRVDGDSSDEISPKLFKEFERRYGAPSED